MPHRRAVCERAEMRPQRGYSLGVCLRDPRDLPASLGSRRRRPLHPPDAGSARHPTLRPGPADWQAVQRLLEPGFGLAGPAEGTILP